MKPEQVGLSIGIGILLASIFFVGVQMALGFTPWLLYVIPLGLTYWIFHLYAPAVVATLCTLLMFVGYDLSPPLVAEHVALTNRTFGAITFGPLAFLSVASKLLGQRLFRLTDQLRMELMERTQDLSRAVSTLRTGTQQRNSSERNQPEASNEFTRELTEMLAAEGRRQREKAVDFAQENRPAQGDEDRLDQTHSELERLGRQLEQLQRDLLRP
jgi:hypothetical protein